MKAIDKVKKIKSFIRKNSFMAEVCREVFTNRTDLGHFVDQELVVIETKEVLDYIKGLK